MRPVGTGDAEAVFAIFASTRAEELAAVPWSWEEKDAFLRLQSSAQERHYRAAYPDAAFDLVLAGEEVIGRLYVDDGEDALHVIDVSLLPEHRGRGIGTQLLQGLIAEGKSVRLYVERRNPARRLYERLGFRTIEDGDIHLLLERCPR